MKYILQNMKSFFNNQRLVFILLIFSVMCSCIMIHFSYGLFQNYQLKKRYDLTGQRQVRVVLQDNFEEVPDDDLNMDEFYLKAPEKLDAYMTVDLMKEYTAAFDDAFMENIKYIESTAVVDDLPFHLVFSVKDGKITNSEEYQKEVENNAQLESGRFFTEKEYLEGERVAISWDYFHVNTTNSPVSNRLAIDERTLLIQGKKYKVIGYGTIDMDRPTIPLTSLEGDTPFTETILFHFKESVRRSQYEEMIEKTETVLGDLAFVGSMDLPNDDAVYLYNTIIMITIFIAIISAINFAILYRYVLVSRRQMLMVYRICGLRFIKAVFLYLGECILLSLPAYLAGVLIFAKIILKQVSRYYEYMNGSYDVQVYLTLFLVYFLVSLLLLVVMVVYALKRDAKLKVEGGVQ